MPLRPSAPRGPGRRRLARARLLAERPVSFEARAAWLGSLETGHLRVEQGGRGAWRVPRPRWAACDASDCARKPVWSAFKNASKRQIGA